MAGPDNRSSLFLNDFTLSLVWTGCGSEWCSGWVQSLLHNHYSWQAHHRTTWSKSRLDLDLIKTWDWSVKTQEWDFWKIDNTVDGQHWRPTWWLSLSAINVACVSRAFICQMFWCCWCNCWCRSAMSCWTLLSVFMLQDCCCCWTRVCCCWLCAASRSLASRQ